MHVYQRNKNNVEVYNIIENKHKNHLEVVKVDLSITPKRLHNETNKP